MATFDYTEMQATAHELIEEFGQAGVVTRITPPDNILGGEPVTTPYPATLVPMAYEARYIDGTVILAGDVQIYISSVGLPITPSVGDTVTANGAEYQIVRTDPNVYDAQISVVHICQARA